LEDFSSASNSVSSAISDRNRDNTVSRPEISCACRNCVIMNTDNRKVMTSRQLRHRIHEARPVEPRLLAAAASSGQARHGLAPARRHTAATRASMRLISAFCSDCCCAHWRTTFCSSRICCTSPCTAPASCSIASALLPPVPACCIAPSSERPIRSMPERKVDISAWMCGGRSSPEPYSPASMSVSVANQSSRSL
jgi:hypothetical protein